MFVLVKNLGYIFVDYSRLVELLEKQYQVFDIIWNFGCVTNLHEVPWVEVLPIHGLTHTYSTLIHFLCIFFRF